MFSIKQTGVTSKPELLYDESRVPVYSLPDCLVFQDGSRVSSKNDWIKKRRKEIIKLFKTYVYGKVPVEKLKNFLGSYFSGKYLLFCCSEKKCNYLFRWKKICC